MTMTSCVRLFLGAAIVCLSAQGVGAHEVNARAKQCPNNANIRGYTSIAELNQDQFDEAMKIGDGTSKSSPPYSFVPQYAIRYVKGPTQSAAERCCVFLW